MNKTDPGIDSKRSEIILKSLDPIHRSLLMNNLQFEGNFYNGVL